MNATVFDISIIVPILNEADELPELLASLAGQTGVNIEVILCDGGSHDGSQKAAFSLAADRDFPVKLIGAQAGRGRQMNAGAALARADLLLFLHADSRFEGNDALLKAVTYFRDITPAREHFAARFGLRFRRAEAGRSLAYFYYEAKARLGRSDCIRGDQGFLLNRAAFQEAGGFDQSLPFLEDLRLVAATSSRLQWLLLPATLSTSARRFEREGLLERQTLNAIIVNNLLAGWDGFFESLPDLYRHQAHDSSGKLRLFPVLDGINTLLKRAPDRWRRTFWQATGQHVASNAWQIFYWLDVWRTFRAGRTSAEVQPRWLAFYQRHLERIFQSRPAVFVAQALVRLWLRGMLFRGTRQRV